MSIQSHLTPKALLENLLDLKDQIIKQGGWNDFGQWLDREENRRLYKGLKRATIEGIIKALGDISEKEALSKTESKELANYEKKILQLKKAVEACFLKSTSIDPFAKTKWYCYTFHLGNRDFEPKIARLLIEPDSFGGVTLYNLDDLVYKSYTGSYKNIHNQAYFFDLEPLSKDRKLHIKVYYSYTEKKQIMLGSYITYESDNHIVTGAMVLEPTNEEDAKPMLLSYKDNLQTFLSVDVSIRRFLLFKRHNYHRVPRGLHSTEELDTFLAKNSERESWGTRFIEQDSTPNLFISSPTLSVSEEVRLRNSEIINKIIETLNAKLADKLSIEYRTDLRDETHPVFPENLKNLRKTRFFVLIYTKTDIGSNSLIQLGWALAYCKLVMLFYEKGSLSDHIKIGLPDRNVFISQFTDLNQEYENICSDIEIRIRQRL